MKLMIDVLPERMPQREVEIPDTCPHCGQDLHESSMLREVSFSSSTSDGAIGEDGTMDYCGSTEFYVESQYIVGYECANCGESVVPPVEAAL